MVQTFLNSSYPNLLEIIIADGGSEDATREIVRDLSEKDSRVKLIDNPDRYQSYALNHIIDIAKGDIFLRADGHCIYQDDYLEKCVEVMQETGAKNVGGSQRYMAKNRVQSGIALAVKSFLGNGGAPYMNEQYEGYADTVFLGCFNTKTLREIGGFNTENITNQDSELNLRLIERYGHAVYVSPEIKSWYLPRPTFTKLFRQYFRYGRGRFLTKMLHPSSAPLRSLMPFLFILFNLVFLIFDLLSDSYLHSVDLLLFLATIVLIESVRIVFSKDQIFREETWQGEGKPPGYISRIFHIVSCVILMQIAHFSGVFYQMLRRITGFKGW